MANKFSQTISFKGEFDISGILQSFKKLSAQMSKQGASPDLLGNIDSEIEKVEKASRQIASQIDKGFSSAKEVSRFENQIEQLYKSLDGIEDSFKQINANSDNFLPDDLDKALKDLKSYQKQLTAINKAAASDKVSGLKSVGFSAESAKDNAKKIKNEQDLIKVLTEEYNLREQIKKQAFAASRNEQRKSDKNIAAAKAPATASAMKTNELKEMGFSQEELKQIATGINDTFNDVFSKATSDFKKVWDTVYEENATFIDALDDGGEKLKQNIANAVKERDAARQKIAQQHDAKGAKEAQLQLGTRKSDGSIEWSEQTLAVIENYKSQLAQVSTLENQVQTAEQQREQATQSVTDAMSDNNREIREQTDNIDQNRAAMERMTDETTDATQAQQKLDSSFESMKDRVKQFLSIGAAITGVKQVIQSTFEDIKELDEAFASIALVTDNSVEQMWSYYDEYSQIANELGQSTKDVISSSALYIQQGLGMNEALELSTQTMKMARLAQVDYSDATSYMTSAIRGFHMEMDEGERVMDVYSELAANAAADVKGIAEAMTRTASIANSAGMEFETTSAFLTQMIETTQESPENLGTAVFFITLICREVYLKPL